MARSRESPNGELQKALTALVQSQANLVQSHASLSQAQATLIQTQAAFVKEMAELRREKAEIDRINAERFARIEAILNEHSRILADHTQILQALTDAVREKIGYSLGDTAANFVFQAMLVFQLSFYTDTFGITEVAF